MLKFVIFDVTHERNQKVNSNLLSSLKQHRISAITMYLTGDKTSLEDFLKSKKISPKELLYVSDDKQAILKASLLGIVSIGIQRQKSDEFLSGAYCIIDSLKNLTLETILSEYNHYHSLPSTILTTSRLCLRELAVTEVPLLYHLYEDPDHVRFIPGLSSLEEEMEKQQAYIQFVYNFYRFGLWGVFLKEDDTLIGRCGLQCYDYGDTTEIELSYLIAPKYCRQGYGYEITSAILAYAKEHLHLTSLIARISPENEASLRLAKHLGFHYVDKLSSGKEWIYRIDL